MSHRPEILFPLFSQITTLPGIGSRTADILKSIGIEVPRDLIFTLPYNGIERQHVASVTRAVLPAVLTIEVTARQHIPSPRKGLPYKVLVEDAQTQFQLIFFHAKADYLQKTLPLGKKRIISGKIELFDGIAQMVHPDHILPISEAHTITEFEAVYPLTAGITQKTMAKAINGALHHVSELPEWIDPALKQQENWPNWSAAIKSAHTPQSMQDLATTTKARTRLAYDEFMAHQLTLALARRRVKRSKGRASQGTGALQSIIRQNLPFDMTNAQKRAVSEIAADMGSSERMNRLLQGDVGAGKTLVAFMALLIAVEAGGQGVMMAPTEILARQHFAGLQPLAQKAGVHLELLTGRDKGSVRKEKLTALANGETKILMGTHAVFQSDVEFSDLRLAIIDEQHRFGVRQRLELGQKGMAVDMLVMTATPIPRSLALAQYGDMDVSILDEKPAGRKPITTAMMNMGRLPEVINHLQRAISEGKQAYWVCPLVEESEVVDLTSVEERFKSLRAAIGHDNVAMVHGQMPSAEKDAAMAGFEQGKTSVLVATTAIEVGVDVPNASIMVIERAENFGLSQLHQLRGRVGRGTDHSSCLLLYQTPLTETAQKRLNTMRDTEDGFKIAETDMQLRGVGDLIGTAQSGLPKFQIADLEQQASLMATAQTDARKLLADDPELSTARGNAVRTLLWLMKQDQAIRLISVG